MRAKSINLVYTCPLRDSSFLHRDVGATVHILAPVHQGSNLFGTGSLLLDNQLTKRQKHLTFSSKVECHVKVLRLAQKKMKKHSDGVHSPSTATCKIIANLTAR